MKSASDGAENLRVQSICVICEEREFNFLTQISQIKRLPHSGIPSLLMAKKTQMIYTSHARGGAEARVENLSNLCNLWRFNLPQMAQKGADEYEGSGPLEDVNPWRVPTLGGCIPFRANPRPELAEGSAKSAY
jgi:hypothetical protein